MKLELKHLSAYFPYSLRFIHNNEGVDIVTNINLKITNRRLSKTNDVKLLLRPLSDLTKEIEVKGEKFIPIHRLKQGGTDIIDFHVENGNFSCYDNEGHETFYDSKKMCFFNCYRGDLREFQGQYHAFQKLLSWHFDIFGLIDAGLAVDINTVKF